MKKVKKLTLKEKNVILRNKYIDKLERQLFNTSMKLYELASDGRQFKSVMHPYILVRVLPKEHKTEGGIWLAETEQNKPVYEGIVLATWAPFEETRDVYDKETGEHLDEIVIKHKCTLNIGDRVVFPHYEGVGMHGYLDDKTYRLIREGAPQKQWAFCSVLGTIDYKGDKNVARKIRELTKTIGSITTSGVSESRGNQT